MLMGLPNIKPMYGVNNSLSNLKKNKPEFVTPTPGSKKKLGKTTQAGVDFVQLNKTANTGFGIKKQTGHEALAGFVSQTTGSS